MEITPLGDSAMILHVRDNFDDAPNEALDQVLGYFDFLRRAELPGVTELAPAYTTVALFYDPTRAVAAGADPNGVFEWMASRVQTAIANGTVRLKRSPGSAVEIPICYHEKFGLDLDEVTTHVGLPVEEVIELHSRARYRVNCLGFTPGFPYLSGLPPELAKPRRQVPRKRVPAGSVGIGGNQTGIYPTTSPGGWNIIGRTPIRLFTPDKNPPALLCPGDHVRFRRITLEEFEDFRTDLVMRFGMKLTVRHAGFITLVQDLGRTGSRRYGVSLGGALDPHALRIANLLVENDEAAAGLEITLGGFRGYFDDRRLVAWCGGGFDVRIGSVALPAGHVGAINPDEELVVNPPKNGCRAWLAISGGIDLPKVLESRSTDLRAEFGGLDGRALRAGDVIPLGCQTNGAQDVAGLLRKEAVSTWSAPAIWTSTASQSPTLRFVRGNNWDDFDVSVHESLVSQPFSVSPDSNRMGVRLEGPLLLRKDYADLISEAVAPGTVQVPPSAKPILLLGDCQTIGGYPRIAHVITVDLAPAAQLHAGDRVRFQEISLPEAHRLLLQRERDFGLFRVGLQARAA